MPKPSVRIFIVDDQPLVREHLTGLLEQQSGWKVCGQAVDLDAGLVGISQHLPDLVLVDWNMPVMDGVTFVQELRRLAGGARPKVVLCTIESDMAHITEAMSLGADEYIMKPFDLEILAGKLTAIGIAVAAMPLRADPLAKAE